MAPSKATSDVGAGTLMVVIGPNGAGKNAWFNAIAGLLPVHQGGVTLGKVGRRRRA